MNAPVLIHVSEEHEGERLDTYLARELLLSRARVQQHIENGDIKVHDAAITKPAYRVSANDALSIIRTTEKTAEIVEPEIPVLYQDKDVLVVHKPAGLVVYPPNERKQPSVAAALKQYIDPNVERGGIVHRLDKDTSGVMVLARTASARAYLISQFKARKVDKQYDALVYGHMEHEQARVELPMGRDRRGGIRMVVASSGKPAALTYKVERRYDTYSLLMIKLLTGRTHQIRVQLSYLGHPVVGDTMYGRPQRPDGLSRQFLHASRLGLMLPNGAHKIFEAELPVELTTFLKELS